MGPLEMLEEEGGEQGAEEGVSTATLSLLPP